MANKKFLFLVFFSILWALRAQNELNPAASIIEKTCQKYNTLSTFSLDFKATVEKDKKISQTMKGVLVVKKEKYLITFEDQIIANDGKTIWNYQKDIHEVSLFEAEDDDFLIFHPTTMLNRWADDYTAKFIREEEIQKKNMIIVDLTPRKNSSFYKIRLFIEKNSSYIQKIMMFNKDETTISYIITKFTPNTTISDTQFIFNKNDYPHVQVNDMR